MIKVLIIYGHTDPKGSVANKKILEVVAQKMPEAEIATLADLYPDFNIDAEREQKRLLDADIIVFEFPVFWYSDPSLLHRYVEQVFTYGFAHGGTKYMLEGKKLLLSFTTGAPEEMYCKDGGFGYTVDELIVIPIKAMCNLCKIDYCGHVYTGGVSYANRTNPEDIAKQQVRSTEHANLLVDKIKKLI